MKTIIVISILTMLGYGLTNQMRPTLVDSAPAIAEHVEIPKPLEDVSAATVKELTSTKVSNGTAAPIPVQPHSGGSCESWMAEAGIPLTNATQELIVNESGCNPNAVNPSSGACGIPQSLPCEKMGGVNSDGTSQASPVQQLIWMDNYIKDRYGTWDNALATWHSRCGSGLGCWY